MYLCYIDESGTSDVPGNTSHYVLAGLCVPIAYWKNCESAINLVKRHYDLGTSEIHTGWILRSYLEQSKIPDFENLPRAQRRYEVDKLRKTEILRLQSSSNRKQHRQVKKNYEQTAPYIHLTLKERVSFIEEITQTIGGWGSARLFAECIDKIHFDPIRAPKPLDEQAFEQLVSRFEQFLRNMDQPMSPKTFGILIHDNNETVAKRHTDLMKSFHQQGTFWTQVEHIIETPLFVNSELTGMIQIADVCAYALRRYLENGEERLFDQVFKRADRKGNTAVGVRHFTHSTCTCKICATHRPLTAPTIP